MKNEAMLIEAIGLSMDATLFDLARHTDPQSSHEAAQEVTKSGTRAWQCEIVYKALQQHDGSTSAELAQYMGINRHVPGRRLCGLEQQGLVRKGAMRHCAVCKTRKGDPRNCVTWWIIPLTTTKA